MASNKCRILVFALCATVAGGVFASSRSASANTKILRPRATATAPPADARLLLPSHFRADVVANVHGARELVSLPNGDLLVGTNGQTVVIVPNAEADGTTGLPQTFVTLPEGPAEGVTFSKSASTIYIGTNTAVWAVPYIAGQQSATRTTAIARVRTGAVAPNSDGDVHRSTSVAASSNALYVAVGSSCNACTEVDSTRATVFKMNLDGSNATHLALRSRNPIALMINPLTNTLWMGGAGQDNLPFGHPYEYLDAPALHGASNVDYGWPDCEENQQPYNGGRIATAPGCANVAVPQIEFPAYSTLIGSAFYPPGQSGTYAFPGPYRAGLYVTAHGSWHCCPSTPPAAYFVPMAYGKSYDGPRTAVNWTNPMAQLTQFMSGFGTATSNNYISRPTGVVVGSRGSLFLADDANGLVYRIRYHYGR